MNKERPILMSAPMVCAVLKGTKTQTRRAMKRQPSEGWRPEHYTEIHGYDKDGELSPDIVKGWGACNDDGDEGYCCPYGKPGDLLWVREAWAGANTEDGPVICYRADNNRRHLMDEPTMLESDGSMDYSKTNGVCFSQWAADLENSDKGWKPSIHMYRWCARLILRITDVRVERLNEISEADAQAEGIELNQDGFISTIGWRNYLSHHTVFKNPVSSYRSLWQKINGAASWDINPWVWVVEFEVVPQYD